MQQYHNFFKIRIMISSIFNRFSMIDIKHTFSLQLFYFRDKFIIIYFNLLKTVVEWLCSEKSNLLEAKPTAFGTTCFLDQIQRCR